MIVAFERGSLLPAAEYDLQRPPGTLGWELILALVVLCDPFSSCWVRVPLPPRNQASTRGVTPMPWPEAPESLPPRHSLFQ